MQREVKTSVKVHHQPGGESNWKLGWSDEKPKKTTINKYHNESNIVFGGNQIDNQEEEKKEMEKRKKDEQLNKQLPDFNPKLAGQSSITFQSDSHPDQQRVRLPPGGKSNIQFG